jgi:hypothetical protein
LGASSISRRKDKGRSGGFGTRSRGVWVRNPTRSGTGCRDDTMSDRRQWKGPDFTVQVFKLTDSDTRVRSRTSPTTNVLAFLRLGQGETDSGDALFSRQETQVLRSHSSGNETESLGLGKGSRSEPGAELRLKIQPAVENRSTGFEAAGPQPDYRH